MGLLSTHLLDRRIKIIEEYVTGDILDVGCGFANVYQQFSSKITNYYGVEYDSAHVVKLQNQYPKGKFFSKDLNEDELAFDIKFDVILMIALIEHIFNQRHLMLQAIRNLDTNGIIVITTPTPFGNDIVHQLGVKIGLFHQEAADDHIVIYNKKRIQILATMFGLKIVEYKYFEWKCNQLVVLEKIAFENEDK